MLLSKRNKTKKDYLVLNDAPGQEDLRSKDYVYSVLLDDLLLKKCKNAEELDLLSIFGGFLC